MLLSNQESPESFKDAFEEVTLTFDRASEKIKREIQHLRQAEGDTRTMIYTTVVACNPKKICEVFDFSFTVGDAPLMPCAISPLQVSRCGDLLVVDDDQNTKQDVKNALLLLWAPRDAWNCSTKCSVDCFTVALTSVFSSTSASSRTKLH